MYIVVDWKLFKGMLGKKKKFQKIRYGVFES